MDKESNIYSVLKTLGLKPASKRVLIALTEQGSSPVTDIASVLNMPKSSVYDALNELLEKSLIVEYSENEAKIFAIPDQDQLARVHQNKMNELQLAHESLLSFLKSNMKEKQVARPKIKFYSGVEGIRQAFRDMPWTKKYPEAYLMWPTSNMIDLIGEEFLYEHRKPGVELGVVVNVIERESDRALEKKYEWLRHDMRERLNRKKYLPNKMDWKMSYWIYGNKCLFASSGSEKIAFSVHSKEFADLQKIMWEQMWAIAKE